MDKIFWAVIILVGIWAAVTPGNQLSVIPEEYNRYRISNYIPSLVYVVFFLVFAYMLFVKKS
jgi:uncharacterized protein HemY